MYTLFRINSLGSIIAYSNVIKEKLLLVNHELIETFGAVSQQVVEAMAIGGAKILGGDYCVATSGIAGPSGGTDDKPVGLIWIAIYDPNGLVSRKYHFGKERDINMKRASIAALNLLKVSTPPNKSYSNKFLSINCGSRYFS